MSMTPTSVPSVAAAAPVSAATTPADKPSFSIRSLALSFKSLMGSRSAGIELAIARGNASDLAGRFISVESRHTKAKEEQSRSLQKRDHAKSRAEDVSSFDRSPAQSRGAQKAQNEAASAASDGKADLRQAEAELARRSGKVDKYADQMAAINERLSKLGYDWKQNS